ncbi:hypothetical protein A5659_19480 [Mycobacterium sp. 1165196.3]|nr:hypothetical protein [Mycobacterium sp. 1165196.3]OBK36085.1 hypothetical protein A5659_19480 [Mycobacterium sp. 1165196.3]
MERGFVQAILATVGEGVRAVRPVTRRSNQPAHRIDELAGQPEQPAPTAETTAAEPAPQADQAKTPCEIAADQLPQAGQ